MGPHLVQRFLQPQAYERGQGVVENQQHDGVDEVVPLTVGVHDQLPRVGTVDLNYWGKAEDSVETDGHRGVSLWKQDWAVSRQHFLHRGH